MRRSERQPTGRSPRRMRLRLWTSAALALVATTAAAQTTPPRIVTQPGVQPPVVQPPLAQPPLAQPPLATADPAGAPRSIIPWLDKALDGDPSALTPAGADIAPPAPLGPADAPANAAIAPARSGSEAVGALPGRAPSADGLSPLPRDPAAPATEAAARDAVYPPRASDDVSSMAERPLPSAGPFGGQPAVPGFGANAASGVGGVGPGAVEVERIGALSSAGAGILTAEEAGLPLDAWAGVLESDAAALVADLEPGPFHSANRVAIRLLSATFAPPRADTTDEMDLLTARMDALMRFGVADSAVAIVEAAGRDRLPEAAEAALVSGRDGAFCEALVQTQGGDGDPLARIYCQAILGDRYGAIAAIDVSRTLSDGRDAELELLEGVADPDLASYVSAPKSVASLTPISLAAMRRLRLDLPPEFARAAPLRFVPAALAPEASPRMRLEALERLEQAGAIGPGELEREWQATASAESGGVWGRVEAYRAARAAPADRFAVALGTAMQRAEEAGREDVMARLLGDEIAARAFPTQGEPTPGLDTRQIRRLLRLAGQGDAASALMLETARDVGPEERAIDRIASAYPSAPWDPRDAEALLANAARGDRVAGRMLAALNAFGVPTTAPDFFQGATEVSFDLTEKRAGVVAFRALDDISRGGVDLAPETFYGALQKLIALGLADDARRIATEVVLLGR